jgi:long-chain acyl-CoA synthetase
MGEELVMMVRVASDLITEDVILEGLKSRIAGYKIPKYVDITQAPLARGATEKFDKRAIQSAYLKRAIAP